MVHSALTRSIPTEPDVAFRRRSYGEGFWAGVSAVLEGLRGPRVPRPEGISDSLWEHGYGATRNDDGSFSAPMSVAHLIPNPAHSKPSTFDYRRALASQYPTPTQAQDGHGAARSEAECAKDNPND